MINKDLQKRFRSFTRKRYLMKLAFAALMLLSGWLIYAGVRVTFFNIPIRIWRLQIQHELSLALWVFGAIACFALMAAILDIVRPRRKTIW